MWSPAWTWEREKDLRPSAAASLEAGARRRIAGGPVVFLFFFFAGRRCEVTPAGSIGQAGGVPQGSAEGHGVRRAGERLFRGDPGLRNDRNTGGGGEGSAGHSFVGSPACMPTESVATVASTAKSPIRGSVQATMRPADLAGEFGPVPAATGCGPSFGTLKNGRRRRFIFFVLSTGCLITARFGTVAGTVFGTGRPRGCLTGTGRARATGGERRPRKKSRKLGGRRTTPSRRGRQTLCGDALSALEGSRSSADNR